MENKNRKPVNDIDNSVLEKSREVVVASQLEHDAIGKAHWDQFEKPARDALAKKLQVLGLTANEAQYLTRLQGRIA